MLYIGRTAHRSIDMADNGLGREPDDIMVGEEPAGEVDGVTKKCKIIIEHKDMISASFGNKS